MSRIIEIARGEVGQTEKPKNSNNSKYNAWFGLPKLPWCGMFVSWCYSQAGVPLPKIGFSKPGFAGCQTAVAYFKKEGKITKSPVSGDIVFFDWNKDGRFDHTGIFEKDNGNGTFTSIEGNTAIGNDSNGGTVMVRADRKYSVAIFVHP
jgi:hypothetical protein